MRPIVSFCGFPTTSSPSTSRSYCNQSRTTHDSSEGYKLQSSETFVDVIKTVRIPDNYKLASFDVKSLFISIPLQLALECTEAAIKRSTDELPVSVVIAENVMQSIEEEALATYGLTLPFWFR